MNRGARCAVCFVGCLVACFVSALVTAFVRPLVTALVRLFALPFALPPARVAITLCASPSEPPSNHIAALP